MRSLVLAAIAALAFASVADAQCPPGQAMSALTHQCTALRPAGGPYHMNPVSHRCQGADGKFVPTKLCNPAGPYTLDAQGKCHAANGQFVPTALCKH